MCFLDFFLQFFFCFLVKSCAMFILLNKASDSVILFKFWNISYFSLSSFSEMTNGHSLSSVAFTSLTTCSIMPWSKLILIMLLHGPMNFLMSSSFLSSCSGFFDSASSNWLVEIIWTIFGSYFPGP